MTGVTNKGKALMLAVTLQGQTLPAKYYYVLVTDAVLPNADTQKLSDLDEVAEGNGYPLGGFELIPNNVDFPNLVVDDTRDDATIGIKEIKILATGGPIPPTGNDGAKYIVITGPGDTIADRLVYFYVPLDVEAKVEEGGEMRLSGGTLVAE